MQSLPEVVGEEYMASLQGHPWSALAETGSTARTQPLHLSALQSESYHTEMLRKAPTSCMNSQPPQLARGLGIDIAAELATPLATPTSSRQLTVRNNRI